MENLIKNKENPHFCYNKATMKKLPIGIQTFSKIREGNYYYVDKTKEAYELITTYSYTFLARPRRFGKSLFLDTLKEIFEGNKKLFEGLYIYDKWNWDEKYPVIKIDWSGNLQTLEAVQKKALSALRENQEKLDVNCEEYSEPSLCFSELIRRTYEKYKKPVVILIDEYDKPILDVIDNKQQALINREFLRGFYSIIKSNDAYIKFAFLTGVSKFSRASIFSGLNMLVDISLLPQFGNICGITQSELETTFKDLLYDVDLDELKQWYNGYYFLKDKVYNPFDVIQFLNTKEFDNYWFASGNPSFLIKLLKQNRYYLPNFENLIVDKKILDVFDVEKIDLEVLLFQAGYLTIKEVIKRRKHTFYKLYFPNYEVKSSFSDFLIDYLVEDRHRIQHQDEILEALESGSIEKFINVLKNIFSNIPYTYLQLIKEYEGFYASVVYVYLLSLGFELVAEDITNKGRIDLTVFVDDKIYIIEFKVIDKDENCKALHQIKEKRYYEKYQNQGKDIYLIGICFDEDEKNIKNFEWEKIK